MKPTTLFALLLTVAACSSATEPTATDSLGNYASTSDYRATERADFKRSMDQGLVDFDTMNDLLAATYQEVTEEAS